MKSQAPLSIWHPLPPTIRQERRSSLTAAYYWVIIYQGNTILKEVFAMLAKILGKVRSYILFALLKGMRFRSKRYLCWQRRRLPQRIYNTPRRLLLAPLKRDSSTNEFQFTA
jgi:hypothetical protein